MARTTGFDHVATVTADLDRIVAFYQHAFDARVTFEMAATRDHPRMVILDLGGGALNVTEQAAGTITGDRARPGGQDRRHRRALAHRQHCRTAIPASWPDKPGPADGGTPPGLPHWSRGCGSRKASQVVN
jgi:catechol 2,3-dioxygenase-like lactoylglutathione lyase family enzyme